MKTIQIQSQMKMMSLLLGSFKSAFHGQGIEFQDFREYHYWDDASRIDWLASSRSNDVLLRRYQEDRMTQILCVIDLRESIFYDSWAKLRMILSLLRLIEFAARKNSDRFWGMQLCKDSIIYVPASRSHENLQILWSIDKAQAKSIEEVSQFSALLWNHIPRSIVFYISDSMSYDIHALLAAKQKHDIILVYLSTHMEDFLEWEGLWFFSTSGKSTLFNAKDEAQKKCYQELRQQEISSFTTEMHSLWIDVLHLRDSDDVVLKLIEFMQKRNKKN